MSDILPFLKSMLSVSGLSGFEGPIAQIIEEKWRALVDETSISRVGSLHGLKRGSGKEPRPALMIAAHMDAIGLQVSKLTDGFLHITNLGGIDIRVLPGMEVTVHASGSDSISSPVICSADQFQTTETTGILISGKMSTGVRRMVTGVRMIMRSAITTNV